MSRLGKKQLAVVIAIASVSLAGAYFGISYFSQSQCPIGVAQRAFTIIANDTTGYNDSRDLSFQMNVQQGDCVQVTFVNNSTTQPHNLAINYYYPNGMTAQPMRSESVRFQANKPGQFPLYENLSSTIGAWTNNAGKLDVL